jgi:F-type H+-transporting ATPase subunit b
MEKLGINLGAFTFYLLNFSALVIVLGAWLYKPVVRMLENRQKKIADGLNDAQVAAEARAKAEAEAQHILGQAQQEASQKLRDAAENAAKAAQGVRADSEAEIAAMHDSARSELGLERDRMLADLRPKVAALAIAAAQKLIGDALDEKRQHALIDEFFSGVRAGKVVLLEESGSVPSAAKAEVTSALPLSEAEQATIRKEVAAKAGAGIGIAFRVDPDLLGGLKVRIGDRVIDGSVAGRVDSLRKSMQ